MSKRDNVLFYRCTICGNLIQIINSSGMVPSCCGKEMERLIPNSTDGATEKHVPKISMEKNLLTVQIGVEEHPMLSEHWIMWIYVETKNGFLLKRMNPGSSPVSKFCISGEEVLAVYCWCNVHGLWYKEF